jgi:hypothetical protein
LIQVVSLSKCPDEIPDRIKIPLAAAEAGGRASDVDGPGNIYSPGGDVLRRQLSKQAKEKPCTT